LTVTQKTAVEVVQIYKLPKLLRPIGLRLYQTSSMATNIIFGH